jgi:hypothetical protein
VTFSQLLRVELERRGVPYELVYGPERLRQSPRAKKHIVLERDRVGGDGLAAARTRPRNPQQSYRRGLGYVLRIFADEATRGGATQEEHECEADRVVGQLIATIDTVVRAQLRTWWTYRSGRLLTAAELEEPQLQKWPGAVYELAFEVDSAVTDVGYDLAPADEATAGGPGGFTVEVGTPSLSGSPEPAEGLPGATTRVS